MTTFASLKDRFLRFSQSPSEPNPQEALAKIGELAARLYAEHAKQGTGGFCADLIPNHLTAARLTGADIEWSMSAEADAKWRHAWVCICVAHSRQLQYARKAGSDFGIFRPADDWRQAAEDAAVLMGYFAELAGRVREDEANVGNGNRVQWNADDAAFASMNSIKTEYNGRPVNGGCYELNDFGKLKRFAIRHGVAYMEHPTQPRTRIHRAEWDRAVAAHGGELTTAIVIPPNLASQVKAGAQKAKGLVQFDCENCGNTVYTAKRPDRCPKCSRNAMTRP